MYRKNILMTWMNLISPKCLYMIIWKQKGHMPCHFGQKLVICEANERLAELLQVERGTAIYKIDYQGADADYNIVEFTMSYLNPAYTKFRFDVEVS